MSAFLPDHCPRADCPSRTGSASFRWRRDGTFPRRADGRRVQRFRCRACRRRFSAQTFRLDYRQQKPQINTLLLSCFVSKVTHRQTARVLRIDRKTVHRRLRLFGQALRELHEAALERARRRGGLAGSFSLDELETYEHNRRLQPLTVPVLVHRGTRFIVHAEVGTLPARGNLKGRDALRRQAQGPRPNASAEMVERCLVALKRVHAPGPLELVTDRKRSYPRLVKRHFGGRIVTHVTESARRARNTANPLFAINHTFAMMRDNVSRLVRRTWAASKKRRELAHHAWIYVAWRNYVRPTSNLHLHLTAAMQLGLADRPWTAADLLRWRWPRWSLRAA